MSNSVNNKLILEPYKGNKKLEMEVKSGFGTVKAKSTLVGLRLLKNAQIYVGTNVFEIPADCVVFFSEETLAASDLYKKAYNFEGGEEQFVIGNYHDAVYVQGLE